MMTKNSALLLAAWAFAATALWGLDAVAEQPIAIGSRRELFVDRFLIEKLDEAQLTLQHPRDEGSVFGFDRPWEGSFCGYVTIVRDGDLLRAYYRGSAAAGVDGNPSEVYCCAASLDGKHWIKPSLELFEVAGTKSNNVILANAAPVTHNFCPFLDSRPDVSSDARYKALGGTVESGLIAYKSADGLRWQRLAGKAVISKSMVPFASMFDSQNVSFWSQAEKKYVAYFRVFKDGIRRIARSESADFLSWSPPVLMEYRDSAGPSPIEHLYTNQTHPYFRASHIYVAIAARFMPGRQVLSDEQAKGIHVHPKYFKDTSDAIFITTRPCEGPAHVGHYDRTFMEGFIRGGIGPQNWVSRTNYPALNVVQTGPTEMSVFVNQDYAQPTAHLRRYSMRLDGFASIHAGRRTGEVLTNPIIFTGRNLVINFATSAAGGVLVELQSLDGKPVPGFALNECREQIGNEIERVVAWKQGADVGSLAGKPVRMRIKLTDADLFSIQFR